MTPLEIYRDHLAAADSFSQERQARLRREQFPLLLARAQREHAQRERIWIEQVKAALRNPFVFLGFCAVAAIAAALLFVWGMK